MSPLLGQMIHVRSAHSSFACYSTELYTPQELEKTANPLPAHRKAVVIASRCLLQPDPNIVFLCKTARRGSAVCMNKKQFRAKKAQACLREAQRGSRKEKKTFCSFRAPIIMYFMSCVLINSSSSCFHRPLRTIFVSHHGKITPELS